jgi:uncharacterized protein (TIGR03437 family)
VATAGNFAVTVNGNLIDLLATADTSFTTADYLEIAEVRVNVNALGAGAGTISAAVSGTSTNPASNPITFTQSVVPVASVVSPSITASLVKAAPSVQTCSVGASQPFSLSVSEKFPAAFTTQANENAFTPDFPVSNGTVLNVTLNNVPAGLAITANAPTPLGSTVVGLSLSTPSSVTSTGAPITFSYNIISDSTVVPESVQFNFNLSLPGGVAGSIPSIGATANITASVTLGPLSGSGITPAFASVPESAGTVATVTNCGAAAPLTFTCNPTAGPTTVGAAYSTTCTAAGGTAPYLFDTNGAIPAGLTMTKTATTVTLSGTPTAAGAYSYALGVSDSSTPPQSTGTPFTGTITAFTPLSFPCSPAPSAFPTTAGVAYTFSCTPKGGVPPYMVNITGSAPGTNALTFTAPYTETVSGTTTTGPYSLVFNVVDSETPPQSAITVFAGTIAAAGPLSITCNPNPTTISMTVGVPYAITCTATGGTAPYSPGVAGIVPAGLTVATTATTVTLSGTPTATGQYGLTMGATDAETPPKNGGIQLIGTIAPAGTPTSSSGGFVSAATFKGGANATGLVTPGGLYATFGSNLGPAQFVSNNGFGPDGKEATTLGGATITFDGVPAPLTLSSAGQLNFQAPFELAGKSSTQVVISYSGNQSVPLTVPVAAEQPTFFTITPQGPDSIGVNLDFTINSTQNPAARGSVVTFYGTGFGMPSYPIVTGAPAPAPPSGYTGNYTCMVGTTTVNALYAGYTPTTVGLVQFNVPIPADAPTGAVPIVCTSPSGASTQQGTVNIK